MSASDSQPLPAQFVLADLPAWAIEGNKVFLHGPAGAGKTTLGIARLHHLLNQRRVSARRILVLAPQRSLAEPYWKALAASALARSGSQVTVQTVGGLARNQVELYWPLIAGDAGFAHPDREPVFLTLETAQYYMAGLVRPVVDSGRLDALSLSQARIISQVLDNLNKAALVGFPHTDVARRLKQAWQHDSARPLAYETAQELVNAFRAFCLQNNLLDFSLQIEVFSRTLLANDWCRTQLFRSYDHLIADNLEEDTPVAHDLLQRWLPDLKSALLIYDADAGYRVFLGADPDSARQLQNACAQQAALTVNQVSSEDVQMLAAALTRQVGGGRQPAPTAAVSAEASTVGGAARAAFEVALRRFYPEMLDWTADRIAHLVQVDNVPASEIAVLAPFVSDSLRFSLLDRLAQRGVPARSHRPSRALRAEPATRCLLTLAALAHPGWQLPPLTADVAQAFYLALEGFDPVRAHLLTRIVYRAKAGEPPTLTSFDIIAGKTQERITYRLGQAYEQLRRWLLAYREGEVQALDHFLSRLFGEVLSQPGFRFHADFDAGRVAAQLIESARKFRWAVTGVGQTSLLDMGRDYLSLVESGLIGALFVEGWQEDENAVLLAPAYTFLMRNRAVQHQFWLDVGSAGWAERLDQPLTHPYVLSRRWGEDQVWTDADEMATKQQNLYRLLLGLLRRCRTRVHLGITQWGEQGFEQQGLLVQVLQRVLGQDRTTGMVD